MSFFPQSRRSLKRQKYGPVTPRARSSYFPRIEPGAVLVEPCGTPAPPSPPHAARSWARERPTTPIRSLVVGVVTHRWLEGGSVPGTPFSTHRELAEVTTTELETITVEAARLRKAR